MPAAAEAELAKAAPRISSPADRAAWTAAVADLAKVVDAGQAPKAGADLFERLRKAAPPAGAGGPGRCRRPGTVGPRRVGRLPSGVRAGDGGREDSKEQALASLSLGYDLSAALSKAGNAAEAAEVLAKAEAFAESLPASAERDQVLRDRAGGLRAGGPGRRPGLEGGVGREGSRPAAADALAVRPGGGSRGPGSSDRAEAPVDEGPGGDLHGGGRRVGQGRQDAGGAGVVEAVPAAAVVEDAKAAADVAAVMQQIHQQRKQTAARQAARCRAVAAEYAAAAKKAEAAKDAPKAAAHAKQAAAFQALATEIEK